MIMKRKSSLPCDKPQIIRREKCLNLVKSVAPIFLLCSFGVTLIFTFFILYPPNPFKSPPKHPLNQNNLSLHSQNDEEEKCDLFKGNWVPELNGSLYTNSSCVSIPESKNCLKNGRMDRDFLNWRWKPNECTLERFDPKIFFSIVRGKKMAFIGDSVARNHMESLLCLLSKEEIPVNVYKDTEDRFRTWHFPFHDFTLMILWSKFLVTGEERLVNGSNSGIFDLHLDMVDKKWAEKLPTIDFAIISDGHWFFRKIYLYQGGALTGCVYCNEPNLTDRGLGYALKMSFRITLAHINACEECEGMVTFLRTFSPAHFENGSWDNGGSCNRTSPIPKLEEVESSGFCLDIGKIQVEEIERARKIQEKQRGKKRFEVLDVTMAMLMRGDGHPGAYWGNKWMKGYNDCVHWCLPGPIDMWNDFLMAMLRKKLEVTKLV